MEKITKDELLAKLGGIALSDEELTQVTDGIKEPPVVGAPGAPGGNTIPDDTSTMDRPDCAYDCLMSGGSVAYCDGYCNGGAH